MKRFLVNRINDVSGTSGTGIICEGCQFSDGKVAIRWLGQYSSMVWWDNLEDCLHIMGHGNNTVVEWIDQNESYPFIFELKFLRCLEAFKNKDLETYQFFKEQFFKEFCPNYKGKNV